MWTTSDHFVGGCGSGGWDCCYCWIGGGGDGDGCWRWRPMSGGHCVPEIYWLAVALAFVAVGICSRGVPSCAVP